MFLHIPLLPQFGVGRQDDILKKPIARVERSTGQNREIGKPQQKDRAGNMYLNGWQTSHRRNFAENKG
jgi:hypothetical protein